jgi:hypothetical protein
MMKTDGYRFLGRLAGHEVGVDHTLGGQDILIEHSAVGQCLASLLTWGDAEAVYREDTLYWRVTHNRQVDDLLVELIELLISIRYTHPTLVQLEMILESEEP